jgi:hypothetical protein
MPGPGLIARYLDALARQLPGPVVEELADGLEETYRRHLSLGLTPAAEAASAARLAFNMRLMRSVLAANGLPDRAGIR